MPSEWAADNFSLRITTSDPLINFARRDVDKEEGRRDCGRAAFKQSARIGQRKVRATVSA